MVIRLILHLLVLLPMLLSSSVALAQARSVTVSNSTTGAINGATTCTSPLVRNFVVASSFVLADVDLGMRGTHTWRGDVRITLQHPDGTRVQLVNGSPNNIDANNFNWRLNDDGVQTVNAVNTAHAVGVVNGGFQNNYTPNNALADFNGKSSAGTWRMEICDVFPTQDNGQFQFAELYLVPRRVAGVAPVLSCPAGELTFDWAGRTWNPGDTARPYMLAGLGTFNWNMTKPTTASYLSINALGGAQPALTNGAQNTLSLSNGLDFTTRTEFATTTITLGETVEGAQFTIFDVDFNANDFADLVRVSGRRGPIVVPAVLTHGVANYVIGNEAFGDLSSARSSADGNIIATFNSPIDQIVIEHGSHSQAPLNPDGQAIQIRGGIVICSPNADLLVLKSSTVLSDLTNGTDNPFAIPGARLKYCILVTNNGSAAARNITASDALPPELTFTSGTLRSGLNCDDLGDFEDENDSGTDESDPRGASFVNGIIGMTASSVAGGTSIAVTFEAVVD